MSAEECSTRWDWIGKRFEDVVREQVASGNSVSFDDGFFYDPGFDQPLEHLTELMHAAKAAYEAGDLRKAFSILILWTTSKHLGRDYFEAYYYAGLVCQKARLLESASRCFKHLMEKAETLSKAGLGDVPSTYAEQATEALRQITASQGTALVESASSDEMARFMEKERDCALAYDAGVMCDDRGDLPKAIENLRMAVQTSFPDWEAWLMLGQCQFQAQDYAAACSSFEEVLKIAPNDIKTILLVGHCKKAEGDIEGAVASYRRAVEMDPANERAKELLDEAESLAKRFKTSVEHYEKGVKLYQSLAQRNYSLPEFCMERRVAEQLNEVILEFLMAVAPFDGKGAPVGEPLRGLASIVGAMAPHRGHMRERVPSEDTWVRRWTAGFEGAKRADWQTAAEAYGAALEDKQNVPGIWHGMGLALFNLGDTDAGVQAWLKTMDLAPGFDFTTMQKPIHLPR